MSKIQPITFYMPSQTEPKLHIEFMNTELSRVSRILFVQNQDGSFTVSFPLKAFSTAKDDDSTVPVSGSLDSLIKAVSARMEDPAYWQW